jgi:hypothetical protein
MTNISLELTKDEADFLRGVLVGWYMWVLSGDAQVTNAEIYETVLAKIEDAIVESTEGV